MEEEKKPGIPDSNDSSEENAEENMEEMVEPETGELVSSRQDIPELDSDNTAENLYQMKETEDNVAKETGGDSSGKLTTEEIKATCAAISALYAKIILSKSSGSTEHSSGGNDGRTIGPHVRFSMPNREARLREVLNLTENKDIEVTEGRMDETTADNSASDKDLEFNEIIERNLAACEMSSEAKIKEAFEKRRDFLIDEATSSKSSSNSAIASPSGESSGDSYPISKMCVSEVSSMPTDISTNISCLEIGDAENQPSPVITFPETPPKRKISSPEYTSPESKKIRFGDQAVEKSQLTPPVGTIPTEDEQTCSNVDEIPHDKSSFLSTFDVTGDTEASGAELHVAGSSGSEVTEESKKAKKRPKKMTTESNDQIEYMSEPKKKKDTEDF